MKFLWISRHSLNGKQIEALKNLGVTQIKEVGDVDAFNMEKLLTTVRLNGQPLNTIVGVVHPAAALTLHNAGYKIAVARNINRAPEGERPQFEFDSWYIF